MAVMKALFFAFAAIALILAVSPVRAHEASAPAGMPQAVAGDPGPGGAEDDYTPPSDDVAPACDFQQWVGKPIDEADAAAKATGRPYRILKPGAIVTQEYSAERINLHSDEEGKTVMSVTCG